MKGFLATGDKTRCFGCEACVQACTSGALSMETDGEGFRYPAIDRAKCLHCGKCERVCPASGPPELHPPPVAVFGGYALDGQIRARSTSGGFFSVLAAAWCTADTRVFGAVADKLEVRHVGVRYGDGIGALRKSKYAQSRIGTCFREAKKALSDGEKVLFSGTPCQIAGLRSFLGGRDEERLLTVEVVCEGVPSPLCIRKFTAHLEEKRGGELQTLDYRDKDGGRWDFEVMSASFRHPPRGSSKWKQDRWFNPFWSIWLQHLISRPSCYRCPFAARERGADITLGDLWGVHLYCPDLYGRNGGASLAFCNTPKGCAVLDAAKPALHGRALPLETALRYQGPMRRAIERNPDREACMDDLRTLPFEAFARKWAKRPSPGLLFSKYVWGNRQKVWVWNLFHRRKRA